MWGRFPCIEAISHPSDFAMCALPHIGRALGLTRRHSHDPDRAGSSAAFGMAWVACIDAVR